MKLQHFAMAALAVGTMAAQASTVTLTQKDGTAQFALPSADDYRTSVQAGLAGVTPTAVAVFNGVRPTEEIVEYDIAFGISAAQAGNYSFTFGLDLGGGGAVFLDGVAVSYHPDDMWAGDGDFFTFSQNLAAGNHSISIYGYEGCCFGGTTGQFQTGNAGPVYFGNNDGLAPVPEPESLAMMLAGLGALALTARRRKI